MGLASRVLEIESILLATQMLHALFACQFAVRVLLQAMGSYVSTVLQTLTSSMGLALIAQAIRSIPQITPTLHAVYALRLALLALLQTDSA
jgi:hypothetical protein